MKNTNAARNESGDCSCTSCINKIEPFLKRIVRTGSRSNKLYTGNKLSSKDKKLLEHLIAIRKEFDKLRSETLSSSSGDRDGREGESGAFLDLVKLVDKGEALEHNELCECCSFCISESLKDSQIRSKSRYSHYSSRSSVLPRCRERLHQHYNAKQVHSDPCTSTSKEIVIRMRRNEESTENVAEKFKKRPNKYIKKNNHSEYRMAQVLKKEFRRPIKSMRESKSRFQESDTESEIVRVREKIILQSQDERNTRVNTRNLKKCLEDDEDHMNRKLKRDVRQNVKDSKTELNENSVEKIKDLGNELENLNCQNLSPEEKLTMKNEIDTAVDEGLTDKVKVRGRKSTERIQESKTKVYRKMKVDSKSGKKIVHLVRQSKAAIRGNVIAIIQKSAFKIKQLDAKRKALMNVCEFPFLYTKTDKVKLNLKQSSENISQQINESKTTPTVTLKVVAKNKKSSNSSCLCKRNNSKSIYSFASVQDRESKPVLHVVSISTQESMKKIKQPSAPAKGKRNRSQRVYSTTASHSSPFEVQYDNRRDTIPIPLKSEVYEKPEIEKLYKLQDFEPESRTGSAVRISSPFRFKIEFSRSGNLKIQRKTQPKHERSQADLKTQRKLHKKVKQTRKTGPYRPSNTSMSKGTKTLKPKYIFVHYRSSSISTNEMKSGSSITTISHRESNKVTQFHYKKKAKSGSFVRNSSFNFDVDFSNENHPPQYVICVHEIPAISPQSFYNNKLGTRTKNLGNKPSLARPTSTVERSNSDTFNRSAKSTSSFTSRFMKAPKNRKVQSMGLIHKNKKQLMKNYIPKVVVSCPESPGRPACVGSNCNVSLVFIKDEPLPTTKSHVIGDRIVKKKGSQGDSKLLKRQKSNQFRKPSSKRCFCTLNLPKHMRNRSRKIYRQETHSISAVTVKNQKNVLTLTTPLLKPQDKSMFIRLSASSLHSTTGFPLKKFVDVKNFNMIKTTSICLLPKANSRFSYSSFKSLFTFSSSYLLSNMQIKNKSESHYKIQKNNNSLLSIRRQYLKRCFCAFDSNVPIKGSSNHKKMLKPYAIHPTRQTKSKSYQSKSKLSKQSSPRLNVLTELRPKKFQFQSKQNFRLKNSNIAVSPFTRIHTVYRQTLSPYECEPKICTPGECDPYDCLNLIKKRTRDSKTQQCRRALRKSTSTQSTVAHINEDLQTNHHIRSHQQQRGWDASSLRIKSFLEKCGYVMKNKFRKSDCPDGNQPNRDPDEYEPRFCDPGVCDPYIRSNERKYDSSINNEMFYKKPKNLCKSCKSSREHTHTTPRFNEMTKTSSKCQKTRRQRHHQDPYETQEKSKKPVSRQLARIGSSSNSFIVDRPKGGVAIIEIPFPTHKIKQSTPNAKKETQPTLTPNNYKKSKGIERKEEKILSKPSRTPRIERKEGKNLCKPCTTPRIERKEGKNLCKPCTTPREEIIKTIMSRDNANDITETSARYQKIDKQRYQQVPYRKQETFHINTGSQVATIGSNFNTIIVERPKDRVGIIKIPVCTDKIRQSTPNITKRTQSTLVPREYKKSKEVFHKRPKTPREQIIKTNMSRDYAKEITETPARYQKTDTQRYHQVPYRKQQMSQVNTGRQVARLGSNFNTFIVERPRDGIGIIEIPVRTDKIRQSTPNVRRAQTTCTPRKNKNELYKKLKGVSYNVSRDTEKPSEMTETPERYQKTVRHRYHQSPYRVLSVTIPPDPNIEEKSQSQRSLRSTQTALRFLKRCFCTSKLEKYKEGNAIDSRPPTSEKIHENFHHCPKTYDTVSRRSHTSVTSKYKPKYQKLESYACSPGVHIPGNRDPYMCPKRIKQSQLYSRVLGTEPKPRVDIDSISSRGLASKVVHRDSHRQKHRNIGVDKSSLSFNIELFKDNENDELRLVPIFYPPQNKNTGRQKYSKIIKKKTVCSGNVRNCGFSCHRYGHCQADDITTSNLRKNNSLQQNPNLISNKKKTKSTQTKCKKNENTLYCRERGIEVKLKKRTLLPNECEANKCSGSDLPKEYDDNGGNRQERIRKLRCIRNREKVKLKKCTLLPNECEPNFYKPNNGRPYECWERIQTRPRSGHYKPSGSGLPREYDGNGGNKQERIKKLRSIETDINRKKVKSTKRTLLPNECEPNYCTPNSLNCRPYECWERTKTRPRSIKIDSKSSGSGLPRGYDGNSGNGSGSEKKIKRCFCSLKFQKEESGRLPVIKFKCPNDQSLYNVETYRNITSNKMTSTKRDKLCEVNPYEFEPALSVPGECSTHERLESIKIPSTEMTETENGCRYVAASSVPSASSFTKPGGMDTMCKAERNELAQRYDTKPSRQNTVLVVPHFPNEFKNECTESVKRDSNFNLYFEINEEVQSTQAEQATHSYDYSPKSSPVRLVDVGRSNLSTGTRNRYVSQRSLIYHDQSQMADVQIESNASLMGKVLKRCFCNLRHQNHTLPPRWQSDVTIYRAAIEEHTSNYYKKSHTNKIPECNPYECPKRIKQRVLYSRASKIQPKSRKDRGSISSRAFLSKGVQAKRIRESHLQKHRNGGYEERPVLSGFKSASGPDSEVIRIGSNLSLNVQFFVDNQNDKPPTYLPPILDYRPANRETGGGKYSKTIQSDPKHSKSVGNGGFRYHRGGPSQADGIATENRSVGTFLNRCFGTLNLRRNKIFKCYQNQNISNEIKSTQIELKNNENTVYCRERGVDENLKKRPLSSDECKPNLSIPGECRPFKCYERIQQRRKSICSKCCGCDTPKSYDKYRYPIARENRYTYTDHDRRKQQKEKNQASITVGVVEKEHKMPRNCQVNSGRRQEPIRKLRTIETDINRKKIDKKGTEKHKVDYRDAGSQIINQRNNTSSGTQRMIKKCICALKLQKKQSHRQPVIKMQCPNNQSLYDVQTHRNITSRKMSSTKRNKLHSKRKPYEFEPGFSVPGECNPYERPESFKMRSKPTMGTRIGPRYAAASSVPSDCSPTKLGEMKARSKAQRHGLAQQYDNEPIEQDTVIELPRFPNKFRKEYVKSIKIGSRLFNIEFHEVTSARDVNDGVSSTSRATRNKHVSHKPDIYNQYPVVGMQTESKASGIGKAIKKCFCTLKNQNQAMPAKRQRDLTVYRAAIEEHRQNYFKNPHKNDIQNEIALNYPTYKFRAGSKTVLLSSSKYKFIHKQNINQTLSRIQTNANYLRNIKTSNELKPIKAREISIDDQPIAKFKKVIKDQDVKVIKKPSCLSGIQRYLNQFFSLFRKKAPYNIRHFENNKKTSQKNYSHSCKFNCKVITERKKHLFSKKGQCSKSDRLSKKHVIVPPKKLTIVEAAKTSRQEPYREQRLAGERQLDHCSHHQSGDALFSNYSQQLENEDFDLKNTERLYDQTHSKSKKLESELGPYSKNYFVCYSLEPLTTLPTPVRPPCTKIHRDCNENVNSCEKRIYKQERYKKAKRIRQDNNRVFKEIIPPAQSSPLKNKGIPVANIRLSLRSHGEDEGKQKQRAKTNFSDVYSWLSDKKALRRVGDVYSWLSKKTAAEESPRGEGVVTPLPSGEKVVSFGRCICKKTLGRCTCNKTRKVRTKEIVPLAQNTLLSNKEIDPLFVVNLDNDNSIKNKDETLKNIAKWKKWNMENKQIEQSEEKLPQTMPDVKMPHEKVPHRIMPRRQMPYNNRPQIKNTAFKTLETVDKTVEKPFCQNKKVKCLCGSSLYKEETSKIAEEQGQKKKGLEESIDGKTTGILPCEAKVLSCGKCYKKCTCKKIKIRGGEIIPLTKDTVNEDVNEPLFVVNLDSNTKNIINRNETLQNIENWNKEIRERELTQTNKPQKKGNIFRTKNKHKPEKNARAQREPKEKRKWMKRIDDSQEKDVSFGNNREIIPLAQKSFLRKKGTKPLFVVSLDSENNIINRDEIVQNMEKWNTEKRNAKLFHKMCQNKGKISHRKKPKPKSKERSQGISKENRKSAIRMEPCEENIEIVPLAQNSLLKKKGSKPLFVVNLDSENKIINRVETIRNIEKWNNKRSKGKSSLKKMHQNKGNFFERIRKSKPKRNERSQRKGKRKRKRTSRIESSHGKVVKFKKIHSKEIKPLPRIPLLNKKVEPLFDVHLDANSNILNRAETLEKIIEWNKKRREGKLPEKEEKLVRACSKPERKRENETNKTLYQTTQTLHKRATGQFIRMNKFFVPSDEARRLCNAERQPTGNPKQRFRKMKMLVFGPKNTDNNTTRFDVGTILSSLGRTRCGQTPAMSKYKTRRPRKRPKKRTEECNMFLSTLRKKPCICVHKLCPWCYPQCLSMIRFWKQFAKIIFFLLAIFVWSPCILCLEACRSFFCV